MLIEAPEGLTGSHPDTDAGAMRCNFTLEDGWKGWRGRRKGRK
jgi:hypothetical protein